MIKIIVGTETGTAEYVADEVLDLLGEHDLNAEVIDQISELSLDDNETLVICTSTHGAGEVPNNLKKFEMVTNVAKLRQQKVCCYWLR